MASGDSTGVLGLGPSGYEFDGTTSIAPGDEPFPIDSLHGLTGIHIDIDYTSHGWSQSIDEAGLLWQGSWNDVDYGQVGSLVPGDTTTPRIVELNDDGVPTALGQDVPRPQPAAEHLQAALGLVGAPSLENASGKQHPYPCAGPAEDSTSSAGSSRVVLTPVSSEDDSFSNRLPSGSRSTPENDATGMVNLLGPCSKVWVVPKKTRKKRKPKNPNGITKVTEKRPPRRRGPFQDVEKRTETALTRALKSCVRCRMLRIRCSPDMFDLGGSCLTCKQVTGPIMCKLPCLRWIITDSSLYREQSRPYQMFSRRWQTMDLVDIKDWASTETRNIRLSQIYLDAPYEVEVREFVPVEGDMLEEKWTSNGVVKTHKIPRYALADMGKSAVVLQAFIQRSIGTYISGTVGESDELIWKTYSFAFQHSFKAKTSTERDLVLNAFRFWVACRKTSNPEHILGEDKLGGNAVDDPGSVFHNRVPMPVIIIAQMECILYSKVLRPVHRKLLGQLNELVKENKRQYWLTIYLTMFILLHSCSMISRRDWETARQYNLQEEYCNHERVLPFRLTYDAAGIRELSKAAELEPQQVSFVESTSHLLREPPRAVAEFQSVRSKLDLNHDLYWVAQLYDENWAPGPTA
ncbi:Zn(2)-C6 fungal-type domain-containing protein [Madurella fahalii]|uniref:Zn(2)-C6 fungal-type domain-containing protein n=1 Tax=Madurella fahalii TaxID=1157608 RepID=A0ABQ0GHR3_9PEZI